MKRALCSLVILGLSAASVSAAVAQQNSPGFQAGNADISFVLGNLEFILLHELAHLIIADLDIPIVGSEESAADYIATLALIRADRFDEASAERARQFLFATANGLATAWETSSNAGVDIQYWGSHTLTIQRYYQIICLIYGSNPVEFAMLPQGVGMPESRSALCANELARADRALLWLFDNYGRAPEDPPGAEIGRVFEPAPSRVSQRIADSLIADGMLDRTIAHLQEQFTMQRPFQVAFRACRDPQAIWLPEQREIRVCYALLDAFYVLGRSPGAQRRQSVLSSP